jgi:PadR family transcriptional regulator PadR
MLPLAKQKERPNVSDDRSDLLKGTLDMLVLKALNLEPMHGWGICERLQHWSDDVLRINQGSLYPALYRLQRQGFIASAWRTTENNREARYYTITAAGRRQLGDELATWERLSRAVNVVIRLRTV